MTDVLYITHQPVNDLDIFLNLFEMCSMAK